MSSSNGLHGDTSSDDWATVVDTLRGVGWWFTKGGGGEKLDELNNLKLQKQKNNNTRTK